MGDGYRRRAAERAAHLHLLAKMYEAGLLHPLWDPPKTVTLTDAEFVQEKTGIQEVFNYAARYGCVPKLSTEPHGSRYHVVAIEMPEHGIKAIVRSKGAPDRAEAAAAREFKKQAELYQQEMGTDSLVVKDSTSLNTTNAFQFLTFCRDFGEDFGRFDVQVTSISAALFQGQAILKGSPVGPAVTVASGGKRAVEIICYLILALSVAKDAPHLLDEFSRVLRGEKRQLMGKLRPRNAYVSQSSLREMAALSSFASRYPSEREEASKQGQEESARQMRRTFAIDAGKLAQKSSELLRKLENYQLRPDLEQLRQTRLNLPMSQYASQVQEIVRDNIYCVIIGATGSGKTTQVPQILLDEAIKDGSGASCNVICTQPRRIAATSVARRVADERAEQLQDTVGYHVRFDARLPKPGGSITYCTTGILLQQLQHAPDEVLDNVSHLVIDEVHERDIIIDFLLIMLKKTMAARAAEGKSLPRVMLMSATVDAERFAAYFRGSLPSAYPTDCPTLSVPGRTFPVAERYLEDVLQDISARHGRDVQRLLELDRDTCEYLKAEKGTMGNGSADRKDEQEDFIIDWKNEASANQEDDGTVASKDDALVPLGLVAATIAHIAKTTVSGAVLAFLPGLEEITKLDKMLRELGPLRVNFNDEERFKIFMLHSSIPDSQRSVFGAVPDGCRKIILSTNIAETSVTIPDVQYVVDTGKSREKRYDQLRGITQLQCTWISKSNIKQRSGRAGRVQNGNYYALFSRERLENMRAVGLPELQRSDLQEICLDVKTQAFKMPVRDFLAEAIEPPPAAAVDQALLNLTALGALTEEEDLTPLGRLLASLPVHPTMGKMIVLGVIFRCLDPMVILGAAAHERPLFVSPVGMRREVDNKRQAFAGDSCSDHITLLRGFYAAREAWIRSPRHLAGTCDRNFIHQGAFKSIESTAREIEGILKSAGLIEARNPSSTQYGGDMCNENSANDELIKALLIAGLYPNIAMQTSTKAGGKYRTSNETGTIIHPSSVNSVKRQETDDNLLTFTGLVRSNDGDRLFMRDTTLVSPLMALLFGGKVSQEEGGPALFIDGWLPFYVKALHEGGPPQLRLRRSGPLVAGSVLKFRRHLDDMLAAAFSDLARKAPLTGEEGESLSARERLADGVADILMCEATGAMHSRRGAPGRSMLGFFQSSRDRPAISTQEPRRQFGSSLSRSLQLRPGTYPRGRSELHGEGSRRSGTGAGSLRWRDRDTNRSARPAAPVQDGYEKPAAAFESM